MYKIISAASAALFLFSLTTEVAIGKKLNLAFTYSGNLNRGGSTRLRYTIVDDELIRMDNLADTPDEVNNSIRMDNPDNESNQGVRHYVYIDCERDEGCHLTIDLPTKKIAYIGGFDKCIEESGSSIKCTASGDEYTFDTSRKINPHRSLWNKFVGKVKYAQPVNKLTIKVTKGRNKKWLKFGYRMQLRSTYLIKAKGGTLRFTEKPLNESEKQSEKPTIIACDKSAMVNCRLQEFENYLQKGVIAGFINGLTKSPNDDGGYYISIPKKKGIYLICSVKVKKRFLRRLFFKKKPYSVTFDGRFTTSEGDLTCPTRKASQLSIFPPQAAPLEEEKLYYPDLQLIEHGDSTQDSPKTFATSGPGDWTQDLKNPFGPSEFDKTPVSNTRIPTNEKSDTSSMDSIFLKTISKKPDDGTDYNNAREKSLPEDHGNSQTQQGNRMTTVDRTEDSELSRRQFAASIESPAPIPRLRRDSQRSTMAVDIQPIDTAPASGTPKNMVILKMKISQIYKKNRGCYYISEGGLHLSEENKENLKRFIPAIKIRCEMTIEGTAKCGLYLKDYTSKTKKFEAGKICSVDVEEHEETFSKIRSLDGKTYKINTIKKGGMAHLKKEVGIGNELSISAELIKITWTVELDVKKDKKYNIVHGKLKEINSVPKGSDPIIKILCEPTGELRMCGIYHNDHVSITGKIHVASIYDHHKHQSIRGKKLCLISTDDALQMYKIYTNESRKHQKQKVSIGKNISITAELTQRP